MNLKKPKFWDYEKPNLYAYLLFPISIIVRFISFLNTKLKINTKIKQFVLEIFILVELENFTCHKN